ncbi:MAG: 50S ribosomal protein L21 [Chloroflexi bacterium]|nr:50S ribosomal protein L21 [Chloroflexota bacterium]MYD17133.1 50S ribosomal protein L21 [Chloroflexota bacterium]
MYAVIRSGGKQYRVSPGQRLKLERFDGEAGDRVTFSDVLLVSGGGEVAVGAPTVESASVTGEIVEQGRGRKIRVFRYKNKTRYRRLRGHRQLHTDVRVDEVSLGDQTWTAPVAEAPAATAAEEVEEAVSLDESTDEPIAEVEEDDAPEASVDESGNDAEDTED